MQDRALVHQLHRIERQLNALVILIGGLVTTVGFAVFMGGPLSAKFLVSVGPGVFVVLLVAYLGSVILTPGRPQPEISASTTGAEGE